jgi:hypothetical protein
MFLQLVDARNDFVINELARRLGNHAVLFGEVFGGENLIRRAVCNEELTTLNQLLLFGYG